MANIDNMRRAYNSVHPDTNIKEFINIAGLPDSIVGSIDEGILTWQDSVWKGIFRGGLIYRKVVLFTKGGMIVQFSSENLNLSNW